MGVEITFFVDLQNPNVKHFVDFFACQIEFFFRFGLSENLSDGGTTSRKDK